MPKNIIGSRLRMARFAQDPVVTQQDLLARLQVKGIVRSESASSKIEKGDRYVRDFELLAMAEVLHVSVLWLLGKE